ncbi:cold-regulated protein 27 [Trifolium pratense]|uniref:cold-regulated protein 27 n=1 Tax=Trifolium pratense TaxID=57577 RepID=UPI001E691B1C|nr:cold-regulated protein 27 [Trifolium pratense]
MEGIRENEEWTDEKHSMYIKSIEASFVNDLYDSKQTGSSFSSKVKPNQSSTGQFKVLRGGCWQKMNFERENSQMSERDNSQMSRVNQHHDLIANPWIQHYRSSSKQESAIAASPITQQVVSFSQKKKNSSKAGQFHMTESQFYHQNMLYSDTEVSDQNFVDEEVKCEKKITSNAKRRKSFDC